MDSCVTAAIAAREFDELAFVHISYGQLTENRERQAFTDIADHYGVKDRLDVSIEHLAKIGGSSPENVRNGWCDGRAGNGVAFQQRMPASPAETSWLPAWLKMRHRRSEV